MQLRFTAIAPVLSRYEDHILTKACIPRLLFSQPVSHVLHQAVVAIVASYWTWRIIGQNTEFTNTDIHQLGELGLNGFQIFLVVSIISEANPVVHKWVDGPNITCLVLVSDTRQFTDFS